MGRVGITSARDEDEPVTVSVPGILPSGLKKFQRQQSHGTCVFDQTASSEMCSVPSFTLILEVHFSSLVLDALFPISRVSFVCLFVYGLILVKCILL